MRLFTFSFITLYALTSYIHAEEQPVPPQTPTPLSISLNYAKGHQEFKELYFKQHEQDFVRLVEKGQNPQALFIGCSDSRVVPDLILGTKPGDLFVIRTAGNFVPTYGKDEDDGVLATVQYALEVLKIKHIIVCGHSHCGAIQGLFKKLDQDRLGILTKWLKWGEDAKKMALLTTKPDTPKAELYAITEQLSIIYQLEHLMTFPFIKSLVKNGELQLHGWYYEIETGNITYYDPELYQFVKLKK
jgi:carbonic anhydrase